MTDAISTAVACFDQALTAWIDARDSLNAMPDDADESAYDSATNALFAVERCLVTADPQSTMQFREKFEALFADPNANPDADVLTALFRDLIRLTKGQPSRVFNAETWLSCFERNGGMWVSSGEKSVLLAPIKPTTNLDLLLTELERFNGEAAVIDLIDQRRQRAA